MDPQKPQKVIDPKKLYEKQRSLQRKLMDEQTFSHEYFYNHATAAMIEISELLQSDTRWKRKITGSTRTPHLESEDKICSEWCDAIIYLMNVAINRNWSYGYILKKLDYVINKNVERLLDGGDNE